jgi:hypothetical protein
VTAKTLSFLFSDWTKKLPFYGSEPSNIAEQPTAGQTFTPQPTGLAEVSSIVSPPSVPSGRASLWRSISVFVKTIVQGVKAIGVLLFHRLGF